MSLSVLAQQRKGDKSNTVTTIDIGSERISYSNLLITGYGSIPVRHFMENLSPHLSDFFKKLQINSQYHFVGSQKENLDINLRNAQQKHQPDAVLMFYELPDDLDTLSVKVHREILYKLLVSPYRRQRRAKVRQSNVDKTIQMALWQPSGNKIIWQGELNINGNPAQSRFYQETCKLVTDELLRHGLTTDTGVINE